MPISGNDIATLPIEAIDQPVVVDLTPEEVALIIDALLQAEMTLPFLDTCYRAMDPIHALRAHQLALANRLEDLMTEARKTRNQRQ